MAQQFIVVLIVAACAGWLGVLGYRYFKPKPGGKACGGGCCDGEVAKKPAASSQERVMMISSDDMRARLKARKA